MKRKGDEITLIEKEKTLEKSGMQDKSWIFTILVKKRVGYQKKVYRGLVMFHQGCEGKIDFNIVLISVYPEEADPTDRRHIIACNKCKKEVGLLLTRKERVKLFEVANNQIEGLTVDGSIYGNLGTVIFLPAL